MVAHDEEDVGGGEEDQRNGSGSHFGQVVRCNEPICHGITPANYYEEQLSHQILSYCLCNVTAAQ